MKKFLLVFLLTGLFAGTAFAEVAIETAVSRSRLAVGEELQLDIIITNAEGKINTPAVSSIDGFTSYSQGRSQEIQIVNGRTSSKSIFSYLLIANSPGPKSIGPFEIQIANRTYKVAPVSVEVTQSPAPGSSAGYSQSPVASPNPRALPTDGVSNQDIFVKVWLDKDSVFVNEPAMLTYTLYTRLSATYRGFEKEPELTGFWVEDFPPEKTIKRTEQVLNGSRYVVADVRKIALFPNQSGVFTIDTGVLSAAVEIRSQDSFDSFFSYNVFGRRSFPSAFVSQVVERKINADKVVLTVKALPEAGKPADFRGAVGNYRIESSLDKHEVEAGTPVTYRIRLSGEGNIGTLEAPKLEKLDSFKVYDSSTSTNISKNRLLVEGEKTVETVIVPKKEGTYTVPPLGFSYFEPRTQTYKELHTTAQTLKALPGAPEPGESFAETHDSSSLLTPAAKEDIALLAKDIRYIKTVDDGRKLPDAELYRRAWFQILNAFFLVLIAGFTALSFKSPSQGSDLAGRARRSKQTADLKLKKARTLLKTEKADEFYAELSKAVHGYFSDKFGLPGKWAAFEEVEHAARTKVDAALLARAKELFDRMAAGRFSSAGAGLEEMRTLYESAKDVITAFEKARIR